MYALKFVLFTLLVLSAALAQDADFEDERILEDMEERALQEDDFEDERLFEEADMEERILDDGFDTVGSQETTTAKPRFIRPIRRKTGIRRRSRPTFTRRCRKKGNMIRKSNCASYLSCQRKFLGLYKSCPPGQLFHATSLVCRPGDEVNCAI